MQVSEPGAWRDCFSPIRPGSPDWKGQTGRINKHKLAALNAPPNTLFYLCGPPGLVEDMGAVLRDLGVSPSRIIFEKWW